jgi:NADPH2:quinone reductase
MQKNARLNGIYLGGELNERPERTHAMIQALLNDCASGALKVVVDRTFALSEAAAAHAYIESRSAFGRVVLVPEH